MTAPPVHGFLIDMDGVLVRDGEPLPGSVEALVRLRAVGLPFRILTNSSRLSTTGLSAWLRDRGFSVDAEEIWNGPRMAAAALRGEAVTRRLALAAPDVIETDLPGFESVADAGPADPEGAAEALVLVTDVGDHLSAQLLGCALDWVTQGAALYGITRSAVFRSGGVSLPDDGFYLAGIETASGKSGRTLGKPSMEGFQRAARDLALPPDAVIAMIGDTPEVDIAGALAAGLKAVLIQPDGSPVPEGVATAPDLNRYLYKLLRIR